MIRELTPLTHQSRLHSCGTMPFLLSSHRQTKTFPLNLPSSLLCFKKVTLEAQIAASCNRRPGSLNERLPHERRWLLCEPSRGVNAWRLAQTAKTQIWSMWWGSLCSLSLHLPLRQLPSYLHMLYMHTHTYTAELDHAFVSHMYGT